jgi:NAD(P)-dependent dehydrogenase (short-subunit alcohol dehydrogenase family)
MTRLDPKPGEGIARRKMFAFAAAGAAIAAAVAPAGAQSPRPVGRFTGKTVVVTGATSGIGRVTAEQFAREGAKVAFCGRREALGREVEAGIKAAGGEASYIRADVRDSAQVKRFIDEVVAKYGRLDVGVNNAGIGQPFVPMDQVTDENYRDMFATNVQGKYDSMVAELAAMRDGGAIVNVSSIFGVKAGAQAVAYCATMHAVSGMTLAAALEAAPRKIRVNAVAPGAITDTQFMRPILGRDLNVEEIRSFGPLHALGRTGASLEVARAILFLASDDASFVAGEIMKVDGYFLNG